MTFQSIDDLRAAMARVAEIENAAARRTWGGCTHNRKYYKDAALLEALQDGAKTACAIGEITGDEKERVRVRLNRLMKEGFVTVNLVKIGRCRRALYSLTKAQAKTKEESHACET